MNASYSFNMLIIWVQNLITKTNRFFLNMVGSMGAKVLPNLFMVLTWAVTITCRCRIADPEGLCEDAGK